MASPITTDNPDYGVETAAPPAVIEEGEVSSDSLDQLGKFTISPGGTWTDYLINAKYESDKHIYQMGLCSPSGFQNSSVAFVQLCAPTLLYVVEWTACRTAKAPIIPDPTAPAGWVLLDEQHTPAAITTGPDASTPVYRQSGVYIYGCKNPNAVVTRDVKYPLPPYYQDIFSRDSGEKQANVAFADLILQNPLQGPGPFPGPLGP